jgi:hypothetical protein
MAAPSRAEDDDVMNVGLPRELIRPILKWGAITTIAFILLFFVLETQNDKLDAAILGNRHTAALLERHVDASGGMMNELQQVRATLASQNRAVIRLLELACLQNAETYEDRRACQQAREGQ